MISLFKYAFFFLSVISLSEGMAQSRTIPNKAGGYIITFPKDWKERIDGSTTDIFAPDDSKYDVWQEFVGVSVAESNGLTLEETFNYYMTEDFPGYYTNFQLIKKGAEVIHGQACKWAIYSFSNSTNNDAATLYNLFYLTLKNDTLYSLNAIAEKSGYPKLELDFLSIIRSFQIMP